MSSNENFPNLDKSFDEIELKAKIPKKMKHKFIKQLNHKLNNPIKQSFKHEMLLSNNKKVDVAYKKEHSQNQQANLESIANNLAKGYNIIRGQWKDNKMNGSFLIQCSNGSVFEGIFQNDLKIRGKMNYKLARCTYEGAFFGQKFSGFGKLSYEGGRTIEGEWDKTQIVGNATITYPNTDVYYGPVDEDLYKHGEGHLFLHNGCKYIGTFKHGSINEFGTYYKGQEPIKVGLWKKGELIKEIENEEISMMGPQYCIKNFSK